MKPQLTKKNMHDLKVEDYVLFGGLAGNLAWETASQIALSDFSKEIREEPGYIGVFAKTKTNKRRNPR